jgi:hypothetical protein
VLTKQLLWKKKKSTMMCSIKNKEKLLNGFAVKAAASLLEQTGQ